MIAQLDKMGGVRSLKGMGPKDFENYWRKDHAQWGELIKALNIKPDDL